MALTCFLCLVQLLYLDSAPIRDYDNDKVRARLFYAIRSVRNIEMFRSIPLLFIPEVMLLSNMTH
jgi:hypothetical protein